MSSIDPSTLYLLHEGIAGNAPERVTIIQAAAQRAGIGFVALDSLSADYVNLPMLTLGDMMFNCGRGSVRLETLLSRPRVASFRTCGNSVFTNGGDTTAYCAILANEGFSAPRTVHRLPPDNSRLASIVDHLGGFPLVIKVADGTMGVGAMLIESMRSLRSVLDFLRTTGQEFILREYIEPLHVARIVVLGDQVIASLKYAIDPEDFRGLPYNMGGQEMSFGQAVNDLAISASRVCRHQFTGVDIIIDREGRPFILEVNPPSNFVALERDLGIPVGDMIVDFLMTKARGMAE